MLRTRAQVRPLSPADREAALELCASDIVSNVFVAARIVDGSAPLTSVLGHREDGRLTSICWASANVVPVSSSPESRRGYAERIRRWRGRCASVFGPRDQVLDLWENLEMRWAPPQAIRAHQPLMAATRPPSTLGIELDERVRPARTDEVELILPAATQMFTAEIGYPPYSGSSRGYRASLSALAARGHTFVIVEGGEVVFKTDVGSLAFGCAQLQGVWLSPGLRGRGLSIPMLATVLEHLMAGPAPTVSLYVNDYNLAARTAYERLGFRTVGEFATVLL